MARHALRLDGKLYEPSRRCYSIMSREDYENGKKCHWTEMEIRGPIKNLSPDLWTFTHLTTLFLSDNNLQVCFLRMCVCTCVWQTLLPYTLYSTLV